jgi:hypothetical protein
MFFSTYQFLSYLGNYSKNLYSRAGVGVAPWFAEQSPLVMEIHSRRGLRGGSLAMEIHNTGETQLTLGSGIP